MDRKQNLIKIVMIFTMCFLFIAFCSTKMNWFKERSDFTKVRKKYINNNIVATLNYFSDQYSELNILSCEVNSIEWNHLRKNIEELLLEAKEEDNYTIQKCMIKHDTCFSIEINNWVESNLILKYPKVKIE